MKVKFLIYFVLLLLVFIPVFGFLNDLPIRLWDESRLSVNALEMYFNKNYLVTFYQGKPDLWNTKPPLLIWFQVMSFNVFGLNEFAFRFPSALAHFLILVIAIIFSEKYIKNKWFGIIWVLVILTSQGLLNIHSSRTGDYDTMLSFANFVYLLSFYLFVETKKIKFLYISVIFITISFLTKGIAGLMFLPALLIYAIIKKQSLDIIKNKHFYFGILIFILFGLSYYFIREYYNNGYINAVMNNEMGGRFLKINEEHNETVFFYFNDIINNRFNHWYLFIPIGIIFTFFTKNNNLKQFGIYSLIVFLSYILIISISKTKLAWYDLPLRPFISFFVSLSIFEIAKYLYNNNKIIKYTRKALIIPLVLVLILFINPYKEIIKNTYKPKEYSWDIRKFEIGYFLKDAVKGNIDLNNVLLINSGYNPQNYFYIRLLQNEGVKIKMTDINNLKKTDRFILVNDNDLKQIKDLYLVKVIFEKYNKSIYEIEN